MRHIIKNRQIVDDHWAYSGTDPTADAARVVLPLAEYLAVRQGGPCPVPHAALGVKLLPADDEAVLKPYLDELALIVVEFPSSGEGRGYTQARLLRERYHYRGELRAAGGVRLDQVFLLARCGFNAFDLAAGENLSAAIAELERFSVAYQDGVGTLVHVRHRGGTGRNAH
jgi:uncharacterized protein (DUF934 family)